MSTKREATNRAVVADSHLSRYILLLLDKAGVRLDQDVRQELRGNITSVIEPVAAETDRLARENELLKSRIETLENRVDSLSHARGDHDRRIHTLELGL